MSATRELAERAWADTQRATSTIAKVRKCAAGYEIVHGDLWTCWLPDAGIEPKPGDTLTNWGRPGLGFTIRGQAINDAVVWYRAEDEAAA